MESFCQYTFEEYRQRYAALYASVKQAHLRSQRPHRGHGLDHDVAVAMMGARIAPDSNTADKAWVAGMLHSTDRTAQIQENQTDRKVVADIVCQHLELVPVDTMGLGGMMTSSDVSEIFDAVMKHGEKNADDDSLVLQVLKDADRLINLQPLIVVRGAQFFPTIPAIELEHLGHFNPESTFREPRNVLDNIRYILEWIDWLRLPKAKELGAELAKYIADYIERSERIYYDLGLAGVKL